MQPEKMCLSISQTANMSKERDITREQERKNKLEKYNEGHRERNIESEK